MDLYSASSRFFYSEALPTLARLKKSSFQGYRQPCAELIHFPWSVQTAFAHKTFGYSFDSYRKFGLVMRKDPFGKEYLSAVVVNLVRLDGRAVYRRLQGENVVGSIIPISLSD